MFSETSDCKIICAGGAAWDHKILWSLSDGKGARRWEWSKALSFPCLPVIFFRMMESFFQLNVDFVICDKWRTSTSCNPSCWFTSHSSCLLWCHWNHIFVPSLCFVLLHQIWMYSLSLPETFIYGVFLLWNFYQFLLLITWI